VGQALTCQCPSPKKGRIGLCLICIKPIPAPVHSGEDPRIIAGLLADTPALTCEERGCGETGDSHVEGCPNAPKKECKGKGAARALAVMVLDPRISDILWQIDPKSLEQARKALEPFGYPNLDALRTKLGL